MNIYGKVQVISVLDNVLVRNTAGIINKEEDIKRKGLVKIIDDRKETIEETNDEDKVATRSKSKKQNIIPFYLIFLLIIFQITIIL